MGKIRGGDKPWETSDSGKQRVVEKEVWGVGWLGDRHWEGHVMGWALGVTLYVGKSNFNKNKCKKNRKEKIKKKEN